MHKFFLMKYIGRFPELFFATLLCAVFITACTKTDRPDIVLPDNNDDSLHSDTLSDHLLFLKSFKKTGSPPQAPSGSALQISFEDTLYLADEIFRPIKFLHKGATQNVAGAFIHLLAASGSTASYYYDVPEIPDMKESDTVSVIMIGIDPTGLLTPQTGAIKIIPYDESGGPIAEIIRPVKLIEKKNDPDGNDGSCGLVLPPGDVWEWNFSFVLPKNGSDTFAFYNDPFRVHSTEGQDIEGHCCNGNSVYPENCPGDTSGLIGLARLHFATYYQVNFENFMFFDNGTFFRHTMENAPLPFPGESDFCGSGTGIVKENLNSTEYDGNWTIHPVTLPPDFRHLSDSLQLVLQTTSSTGTGFGNTGGVIHQLDCESGSMMLIQLDREGGTNHLFKYYERRKAGEDPLWYN